MPRLIGKLHRKYAAPEEKKDRQTVKAQKKVLRQVVRKATQGPTHQAVQSVFGRLALVGLHLALAGLQQHDKDFHKKETDARPYVVVVGAGFAGLACAYELAQSGQYNVVVLEASERVGGRVWSVKQNDFENTISSTTHEYATVERGGELIGLNHFMWLHYADLFDLHLDYLEPPSEDGDEDAAPLRTIFEYMKLIILELDEAAAKLEIFTSNEAVSPWETSDAKRLDSISLETFLNQITEKYRKISLAEVKAKGFTLPEFNIKEFEQAMACTKADFENNNGLPSSEQSLYFNLVTIGNGNRSLNADLLKSVFDNIEGIEEAEKARKLSFWEDAELFRCREGNMSLAVKFHEHLIKLGADVRLNTTVTQIAFKDSHVKIVTDKGPLKLPRKKISRVVLATSPSVWKHIQIAPPLPQSLEPKSGLLVKYLFEVEPSVTGQFRKLDGSTHTQWGMTWEAAKNDNPKDANIPLEHTLAVFAGGANASVLAKPPGAETIGVEAARKAYICENFNKMRPQGMTFTFTPQHIVQDIFMDWPETQFVQAGYSCPAVNEVVTLGPIIHNPINDRLHLAGEFACRYQWCGFMEGALLSGAGAAKDILNLADEDERKARVQKAK